MKKTEVIKLAKQLKDEMKERRESLKGSLLDIAIVIEGYMKGEYDSVFLTKLYKNHGGEYCEYLELISRALAKMEVE